MNDNRLERVGIIVRCVACGRTKKPIGRSGPLEGGHCDDECRGYRGDPYPGSLWPGETEGQFGFKVGEDGTTLRAVEAEGE